MLQGQLNLIKRKMSVRSAGSMLTERTAADMEFDNEAARVAEEIFRNLNNGKPSTVMRQRYRDLDPIYRDPKTGGVVFVGNAIVSETKNLLDMHSIQAIVNCTSSRKNVFAKDVEEDGSRKYYYRFPIAQWAQIVGRRPAAVNTMAFVNEMLDFIEDHLAKGHSVLIHCLAGAHRAGTTGVIYLMAKHNVESEEAIILAKTLRPVIDPIKGLSDFLKKVDRAVKQLKDTDPALLKHWGVDATVPTVKVQRLTEVGLPVSNDKKETITREDKKKEKPEASAEEKVKAKVSATPAEAVRASKTL